MRVPQDNFIEINDLRIHYLDWGNPEAPPMLLLHGLCSNSHYWDYFAPDMVDEYHVIAIDQRGHGDSSWADRYGPRDYVADIDAFVSRLQLNNITLIGHSLGGINAILFAAIHPDLISKLVIIDIGPEIGASGAERMLNEMNSEPESYVSILEAVNYLKTIQPRYSESFLHHQIQHSFKKTNEGLYVTKFDSALRQTSMNSPEWLWDYIEMLVSPTLLLRGAESDVLFKDTADSILNVLFFGAYSEIAMAGHSIPGDNPREFVSVVSSFLTVSTD